MQNLSEELMSEMGTESRDEQSGGQVHQELGGSASSRWRPSRTSQGRQVWQGESTYLMGENTEVHRGEVPRMRPRSRRVPEPRFQGQRTLLHKVQLEIQRGAEYTTPALGASTLLGTRAYERLSNNEMNETLVYKPGSAGIQVCKFSQMVRYLRSARKENRNGKDEILTNPRDDTVSILHCHCILKYVSNTSFKISSFLSACVVHY